MPEWANMIIIFVTVFAIVYVVTNKTGLGEILRNFWKDRRMSAQGRGREAEKGGPQSPSYFICTTCLQGFIIVPKGCRQCGGDTFQGVTPFDKPIDISKRQRGKGDGQNPFRF